MPGVPSWALPPAKNGPCLSGGHRSLHELAVAIATTGRTVEVRGQFDFAELSALAEAAGAMPGLPEEPRRPQRGDVVVMPEGFDDPLTFGIVALSEARAILLLLAPSGLFGWSFLADWHLEHPHEIAIDSVALAEHHRAMKAMGFELWTESPRMAERIEAIGIGCETIGVGRPIPYPAPPPKQYDVVTFAHNRWADLARSVVSRLDGAVTHHEIPSSSYEDVLRQLGQARVLIHPMRVEGGSRIGQEARGMGTVPIVLGSNPYSLGLDEPGGAVQVSSLDEMPATVTELLRDHARLTELRERGVEAVKAQIDWEPFVGRVDAALSREAPDDPGRGARAAIGNRLEHTEALLRAELNETQRVLGLTRADRDYLEGALEGEVRLLKSMQDTRVWRLATRFWHLRDSLRRTVSRLSRRSSPP